MNQEQIHTIRATTVPVKRCMFDSDPRRLRKVASGLTGVFCIGLCLILAALPSAQSKPTIEPWCTDPRGSGTGAHNSDCMYYSYEQCRTNAGMCIPNPSMDPLPVVSGAIGGSPPSRKAAPNTEAGVPNGLVRRTRGAR